MSDTGDVATLLERARAGDRGSLARLLTLVERSDEATAEVQRHLDVGASDACILGITGAPGAGKSTLVGELLRHAIGAGHRVAVLAVDPSSPFTRGALLGDRVRMSPGGLPASDVFIRSMATRGQQGGLAHAAQTCAALLAACGWPWIILETVGAGQVEVDIAATADITVVVLNPGWGDEIQAHKAGMMEIGDIFVINKADRPGLSDTRRHLELLLAGRRADAPHVPVVETVAVGKQGIEVLWQEVTARQALLSTQIPRERRRNRLEQVLHEAMRARLAARMQEVIRSGAGASAVARLDEGAAHLPELVDELVSAMFQPPGRNGSDSD
ncbi:MAG: methylmalonyl Co-A mutase-associated GTPase MeaB [Gammaproteobacteria bacterium]|nr:methylmalonyl Co-A mutase-associated GTPase MeaB [Gammaproteobacteria bacterium]